MRQLDFRLRIGCPVSVLGLSILLVALVGCGRSDLPELGEVSGVVTWNGKPLPAAVVKFQPASGRPSSGITDEQGKYTLLYVKDTPGAAVGKHTVSITMQLLDADQREGPQITLPDKYNTQTTLSADVAAGEQTIDFELVESGEVSGVVTWNGKPLPTAVVKFQPASGRPSSGITDEQGKYTLLYVKDTPGAAVGKHTVSITMQLLDADQREGPQMTLPDKYNTQTTLSADVVAGEQTIDFELVE